MTMGQNVYNRQSEYVRQRRNEENKRLYDNLSRYRKPSIKQDRERLLLRQRQEECYVLGRKLNFPDAAVLMSIEQNGVDETLSRLEKALHDKQRMRGKR